MEVELKRLYWRLSREEFCGWPGDKDGVVTAQMTAQHREGDLNQLRHKPSSWMMWRSSRDIDLDGVRRDEESVVRWLRGERKTSLWSAKHGKLRFACEKLLKRHDPICARRIPHKHSRSGASDLFLWWLRPHNFSPQARSITNAASNKWITHTPPDHLKIFKPSTTKSGSWRSISMEKFPLTCLPLCLRILALRLATTICDYPFRTPGHKRI